MPTEKILIVAKTRMKEGICVSGITSVGQGRRLLMEDGRNQPKDTLFNIGEIWKVVFELPAKTSLRAPHVEDIYVKEAQQEPSDISTLKTLKQIFQNNNIPVWKGHISKTFDGLLRFTNNGKAYIQSSTGIPDRSAWFWELDQRLEYNEGDYLYSKSSENFSVKYVGLDAPLSELKPGVLLRMSLARWKQWDTTPHIPERCYLQLSGWYL